MVAEALQSRRKRDHLSELFYNDRVPLLAKLATVTPPGLTRFLL